MNLQLATSWLDREHAGFSDLHRFSTQLRDTAAASGRESAALLLLAEKAAVFCERHEGAAVSTSVVDEFISGLRADATLLVAASAASDTAFLEALNGFASKLAPTLVF